MAEQQSRHDDSAEALRSMAEASKAPNQSQGQSEAAEEPEAPDALAAMAEGRDLTPAGAVEDKAPDPPPEAPAAFEGLGDAGSSTAARRARAASLSSQKGQVSADQFKRVMIPLLIVVGLMLLVLGGVVAILMPSGGSGEDGQGGFAKWAVVAAFPLGAVLLFGAWFFHRELKHSQKK